jgi:hypothetical protein
VRDDPDVVGLVAVGSTAGVDYEPDEWSDHDFFLIVRSGEQERYRRDLGWLPHVDRILLRLRETAHGLKVVFDDGHLLEFAVFDLAEIRVASVNRYRVLLDRGGVEDAVVRVATTPRARNDDEYLFGMTVAGALVGAGRARRGETLSGAFFVSSALTHLAALLERALPSANAPLLDDFDPLRRFEIAYPELGVELARIVRLDPPAAAVALLRVAERELRPVLPELPWPALGAVRARLVD